MGRRNRSKRNRWDDEDEDDAGLARAEEEWLMHRRASASSASAADKRRKTEADDEREARTIVSGTKSAVDRTGASAPRNATADDEVETKANDARPNDGDGLERLKSKKRRQKERRREKKAQAAAAAEEARRRSVEAERAANDARRREQERKRKMREAPPREEYVALAKGVRCRDLVVGKGPPARDRKKVRVSYTLRSKSHASGKVLDGSSNFGFRLGKGEVVEGWDIGLRDMRVGGVRRLVVPPGAGYGRRDVGAGKGADLYFQIELLHVAP
ncbi:hypothetical protein ACHAWF_017726 [Thalassiosira exigua]